MIAELKTFIAVVQHGTFAAAADRIGLTQAAVSGHIKRLESRLGFSLFDRSGHSAKLNSDGHRTLLRAHTIVQLFEALGDPEGDGIDRELRIGAIGSARQWLVQPAMQLFHARYPAQRVTIVPGVSMHLLDRFDNGEIDLAVIVRPPFNLSTDANFTPITHDSYVLLVPAACQESDWRVVLQRYSLLGYDPLSFTGRQVDRFLRTLSFPVKITPEVSLKEMITEVGKGAGVALYPLECRLLPLSENVRALSLQQKGLYRELGVVTSRQRGIEPTIDFLKLCFVEAAARQELASRHLIAELIAS